MRISYAVIFVLVLSFVYACQRPQTKTSGVVVARVGDKVLYLSEVGNIFTPEATPEDSVRILETHAEMWVRKQLRIMEAEKTFSESSEEIEKLVEEYRQSLLSHRLEQYFVETRLDSIQDESRITEYYNLHKSEFPLDRAIVKGAIVKVPESYRQRKTLTELMSGNSERYQDFVDTSTKNDFELHEALTWTDINHFLAVIPAGIPKDETKILENTGVTELRDGSDYFLIYISDRLYPGDDSPVERVQDLIARVLYNQRKQEIIRSTEDSIYNAAGNRGIIEINVKRTIAPADEEVN